MIFMYLTLSIIKINSNYKYIDLKVIHIVAIMRKLKSGF